MTIIQAIKDLRDKFKSLGFVNNATVKWRKHGSQWEAMVEVPPVASGGTVTTSESSFPCKITGKTGPFYTVDKYENGIDAATTGTANLYVLQLTYADTLPTNTWVIATASAMGSTGGGNF